ncbi:MAG: DNA polymerase III subunit gamma/tau [Edaphocola sp.]
MSEQYIVSARKYRPQTFDTVVGQQHITTTLKNAIKTQHLAHAYLFCGPRGVGKTTCARILARTINCENPTDDMEACGQCGTCLSFKDNTSFNIFELDAASNNSVDDIRSLTEQVRYAPQHGKYKIYIIDEVHMLSTAAFNAFLKTLEEPPGYAIFILATTEKHKILPTILSRCQIFDFKRIQTEGIAGHLANICAKENVAAQPSALHIIAQKSEGCMRDALSMMDRITGFTNGQLTYTQTVEHLNILDADIYFKLGDILLAKDIGAALLMLDDILQRGFEGDVILNGFAEHFRNLLLSKDGRMARLLDVPEEHRRQYFDKAQMVPSAYILSGLSILNEAELGFRTALNKRLHLELCLIRLCYLNDVLDTNTLAPQGVELKKKPDTPSIAAPDVPEGAAAKPLQATMPQPVTEPTIVAGTPPPAFETLRQDDNVPSVPEMANVRINGTPENIGLPAHPPNIGTAPQETAAPMQPYANTSATLPGKRPKLGRNLLRHIQEQNSQSGEEAGEPVTLNQQEADLLLEKFRKHVREELKQLPMAAQLDVMNIEYVSANELRLVCTSELNQIYANSQQGLFLDFGKKYTRIADLRIKITLDENALTKTPAEKVLTKQEIYEQMTLRNPALKALRDGLNMQLDY